jgi:pimeloyl-ACP methyl ester carboxylesterase
MLRSAPLLATALPQAELATLHGVAHLPSLERPDDFDALVLPFVSGGTGKRSA